MYKLFIKPLLFLINPEKAHYLTFYCLKILLRFKPLRYIIKKIYTVKNKNLEKELFSIKFPNPVGLAAGFDKDALLYNELFAFGFGFVEIGTVTPLAQPGNEKPRLFRLKKDHAIINRMGFNNRGAAAAAERLKNKKPGLIVGGNIGKNKNTPNEQAVMDYLKCYHQLYNYVDYFVINVSSPNTPGLRQLQDKEPLKALLITLVQINKTKPKPKPILLKIAPDLSNEQLDDIIEITKESRIDGIIATNTTLDRSNLSTDKKTLDTIGAGGLSGKPLTKRSTEVIKYLSEKSGKSIPIIGVGGIHSAEDALEKINAGASLVQVYTGFIYEGPGLIKKINQLLLKKNNS
jgi:dihydroorotate dehydrogenase